MSVQFSHPWVLFLIWLVPAVALWGYAAIGSRERAIGRFVSATMQHKSRPERSRARIVWQGSLITTGLLLLMAAAAGPQWGMREVPVLSRGRDLVIALDVSNSMLADDVHPNRLERAKADLLDLIRDLRGDRAALVAFRQKANLLCPLTTDYAFLRQMLDTAGPNSAPRGETDIGDAIIKALEAFESHGGDHKAIILISDGEDLGGEAISAAKRAAERNIPIFTVGIGSRGGAKIPSPDGKGFVSHGGEQVVSRLNHEGLLAIAQETRGAYIPIERASTAETTLGTLYQRHLRNISAQDLEETHRRLYVERYPLFLLPGLTCLMAACFLSRGRLAGRNRDRKAAGGGESPSDAQDIPAVLKDLTPPQQELRNI